ncbi:MAG: 16S rRNA (cytosine(1402)-N(4))-methyltransferase RsmH [Bacteroidales bacterium]|nr:16S rRNA (cytosine(1402)-N(4))-methyltransferase RsmH [Bacteroidales bacterium]
MNYHVPVLLSETIEGLKINPSGTYVDATFGGGGHSREIIKKLTKGKLIGFDQDAEAVKNSPKDKKFIFVHSNFRFIRNFLKYYKIEKVDGILADLGVSSHHFDSETRGFSFRHDSMLDMRMNTGASFTAATLVNEYTEEQLMKLFRAYGEIENAARLTGAIAKYRNSCRIERTGQLIDAVSGCIPFRRENQYLAKVFQAIRIEVNKEMVSLKELLVHSTRVLKTNGRIAVISYHSLEDRLVKNYFRWGNFEEETEKDIYGNFTTPFKPVTRKPIVPREEEIEKNNRARSARLRIAEKLPV